MINDPLNPPPGQTPPGGLPPQGGQTPPAQPPPPGQTPPGQQPPVQRTPFDQLPLDVQDYIKSLRDEAKETRKALDAEARAKQQAEEARLQEQGQWKALAEKHQTRVQELEPIAADYAALASLLSTEIEEEIKDWPPESKTFYPGKDAPIKSLVEWRNKARPLVTKLQLQAQGQLPGNRPNPTPQGGRSFEERVNANMAELKKQRTYGI